MWCGGDRWFGVEVAIVGSWCDVVAIVGCGMRVAIAGLWGDVAIVGLCGEGRLMVCGMKGDRWFVGGRDDLCLIIVE